MTRKWERPLALFVFALVLVLLVLMVAGNGPVLVKLGLVQYCVVVLVDLGATAWRGRGADPDWNRRMGKVRLASFAALLVLVAVGWLIAFL